MRALNTAATGMMAQELNVQVIANNIANMRTTGYKRQRAEFQDMLYEHVTRIGTQTSTQGNILPVGVDLGSGVKTVGTPRIINSQGQVSVIVQGNTNPTILGQLSLTSFLNEAGLLPIGDNLFQETPASGPPQDGLPATNGMGSLQQGNLEQSNVEAVTEISDLIAAQRAYEMNSKVISATDQMLQSVIGLYR